MTARSDRPDWLHIRADFPVLTRQVHGRPLVYLDSANTSQKPQAVIRAVDEFYREHNANVSRAVHALGSEATEAYEGARSKLATFLNVPGDELVLTSGTTFGNGWAKGPARPSSRERIPRSQSSTSDWKRDCSISKRNRSPVPMLIPRS